MSKKLWVVGQSGNESGRPQGTRYSVLTTRGRIERFLCKNLTARATQALYNSLSPKDQYSFIVELLPYVMPKEQATSLTSADVDKLYNEISKVTETKIASHK